ncbi:MAG TPA: transaldolase family protein [Burkholderiaceae bacterium]|nr:transaldolase family protein [Burkholderiaceae bacterium]
MKIFLDSAQVNRWQLPAGCPAIQGVTTNPSLIHQAGLPVTLDTCVQLVLAAAVNGMQELMVQLPDNDTRTALQWLDKLRTAADKAHVRLTIKLPCHAIWLPTIKAVQQEKQAILLTGLANPVQLLWAASLKAEYVAPYVGRLVADGRDVWPCINACVAGQKNKGTALLAASIKSPDMLTQLIASGAAAVTLPPDSLIKWSSDPLTDTALAQFAQDTANSQNNI